jgi:hypothetical protein
LSTLVVHVWEAGPAYEAVADPTLLPAPIDIRTAIELDEGAGGRRRDHGPRDVARVAQELDARAIVIGSHGHRALREFLLGSTTRSILKDATCPVVVVRDRQH